MLELARPAAPPLVTFDEERHLYFLDGKPVPGVSDVLRRAGLNRDQYGPEVEAARERGKRVHLDTARDDDGTLYEEAVFPEDRPYLEAWRAFRAETGFEPFSEWIERPAASATYRFAGTDDRVGLLHHDVTVIDIKTGGERPWWRWQTAAYQILYAETPGAPPPYCIKRACVQLLPTGRYVIHPYNDRRDRDVFLAGVTCVHAAESAYA